MKKFVIGTVIFLLILTVAILQRPSKVSETNDRVRVAATIFPIYDIARNVAGDEVQVTLVLKAGAEPHTFEPTPSTMRELQDTDVVYAVGHGIDAWTDQIVTSVGAEIVVVDAGVAIRPSAESDEGPDDPHYWLTVPNAKKIAQTIADDLTARFPDRAAAIRANLSSYLTLLDGTDTDIRSALAGVNNKNLVTLHDAWYYFADEYGLTVAGTFEPSAGREPSPQYLADLIAALRLAKTKTLYYEPQFSIETLQTFADDYDLTLAVLDDIGGVPGRDSYVSLMLTNAKTIAENQ